MTLRNTLAIAASAAILSLGLLPITAAQADEAMKAKVMANCEMMMKGDMAMQDDMMKEDMMKKCGMMMKGEKIDDAGMMKMDEMMTKDGMMKDDMKN